MIASVIVDLKARNVNKPFDYLVPKALESTVKVGLRVKVPFGNQRLLGIIVCLTNGINDDLKEIDEFLDFTPCLTEELIKLAKNMHEYYFSLYITCLETMIPSALRANYEKVFRILNGDALPVELKALFVNNVYHYKKTDEAFLAMLLKEVKLGNLSLNTVIKDKEKIKMESIIYPVSDELKLTPPQEEIINYLKTNKDISKTTLVKKFGSSRVNTLLKKGALTLCQRETFRAFDKDKDYQDETFILTEEQETVYQKIKNSYGKAETFLLHGVTGSGKTEIYLKVIEDVIKKDKTAILLVPEISLTPQIVARFKARFKDDVAVIHSGLSKGEKYDEWRKIIRHEVHIAIGARSAVFAPLENIGVIIIDEEHESSYIQDNMPKYDARVIARIRARNYNALTILGSATPSIESYYKALNGTYQLLSLTKRVNQRALPNIMPIDMGEELKSGNHSLFSRKLQSLMKDRLTKGEQTILLLNRRGFSSFVMCRECGEVIKCPHCAVSLTYHKYDNSLKCHYCGYQMPLINECPKCHSKKVRMVGGGTERVVAELNKIMPEARVLRMDNDTTSIKGGHEKIITAFLNHEADILVGTQMVAKGLNFPLCTLVGILNADLALKYPNFTSSFQAFSLFVQVAGRAGRNNLDGTVIMQTYDMTHYAIRNALTANYKGFYQEEIAYRRLGDYPPYSKMVSIKVTSTDYDKTYCEALKIANALRKIDGLHVLGPAEDFIVKLNDKYNFIVTIKYINEKIISSYLIHLYSEYQSNKEYSIIISRM